MRIFIDARMRRIGGNYTYTISLLRALLEQDEANNKYFVLYSKGQKKILPEKSINYVTKSNNPIYWLFWDNFILPKIVRKNDIDIYHSFRRCEISRIPAKKIITVHSAYPYLYPELRSKGEKIYWGSALKRAMQHADAVLAVSEMDRKSLIDALKIEPSKVFVHHLALSNEFRKKRDENKLRKVRQALNLPDKYLLFVGTFYLFKNIPNIIKAFGLFKRKFNSQHKLVLVGGEGSGSTSIQKAIEESKLDKDIIVTGPIFKDLDAIYSGADAFLFPTLYDSFGFPVLEAMSCGVPTIISDRGALPEVAGEAALKYDPNDIHGIAEGIKKLISDEKFRQKMVKMGHDRVKEFSWGRCATETIALYQQKVNKK
jgi:glycosyltransferase involved in cell wall biosynthesis